MTEDDDPPLESISATYSVMKKHSLAPNYLHIEQNSDVYSKCKSAQQFTAYFTTKYYKENDTITIYYMVCTIFSRLDKKKK